jgi:hypothetical protein
MDWIIHWTMESNDKEKYVKRSMILLRLWPILYKCYARVSFSCMDGWISEDIYNMYTRDLDHT